MATKIHESREVKDIMEICRGINLILYSTMLILFSLYTVWIFLLSLGREMQVANRSNAKTEWRMVEKVRRCNGVRKMVQWKGKG